MQCGARHSSVAVAGARGRAGRRQRQGASNIDLNDIEEDSFFAIQVADLRWLYDLWAQLADESRSLDRQAIAKRLAAVLENAEFF
jgi:hypothetical protein